MFGFIFIYEKSFKVLFVIPYVVITMEKTRVEKERDLLLDWIKHSPPSNLTKELLLIRLSDAEYQLTDKTRELENITKYCGELEDNQLTEEQKITKEQYKEMEKQKNLADKDFIDMKDKLEKIILSKDNQIMDLEREVRNNKEEIDTLVKMTTKKKKRKTKENEENNENKIIHLQNFLKDYCKWTAKRVNKWDPCTKRTYELAPGSGDRLFESFRIYCVANNIISDVVRNSSTTIPTKKEFMELIVQEHKERYSNDWCQKNKQYPQSPNGSYATPRVNLILIKDPKTGEELFKK